MLERYIFPIAPYLFMTTGLSLCIGIWVSVKREVYRLRARLGERDAQLEAASQALLAQITDMRAELHDAEARTSQLVPPTPARSGLNVNTRTQVLRMSRHGEAEDSIASKLGLPRNEVSLLLKVHKLAVDGASLSIAPEPRTSSSAAC